MKKNPPKILDALFGLYPTVQTLSVMGLGVAMIIDYSHLLLALLIFDLYLLSPLVWKAVRSFWGEPPKLSYLGKKVPHGNLWFVTHQLQWIYTSYPGIERLLMAFPGLYSAWLRVWGAKIGKKVNWTSECKLVDRPFLTVGDRALIGNRSYLSAHAIKKKDGKYVLFMKPIIIGEDAVLAYACVIGPGVKVGKSCLVEAGATMYPGDELKDGETYVRYKEILGAVPNIART